MVSLLMAALMSGVTTAPVKTDYAAAYNESVTQQKPLLVVVGAEWCPACKVLKQTTINPMAETGELDAVSVVVVDKDNNPELAKQLTKGDKMLPQIIVYTKTNTGRWQRDRLKGYQPKQPVRNLIRKALSRG